MRRVVTTPAGATPARKLIKGYVLIAQRLSRLTGGALDVSPEAVRKVYASRHRRHHLTLLHVGTGKRPPVAAWEDDVEKFARVEWPQLVGACA